MLLGPVLIGVIAEFTSLRIALASFPALALVVVLLAGAFGEGPQRKAP